MFNILTRIYSSLIKQFKQTNLIVEIREDRIGSLPVGPSQIEEGGGQKFVCDSYCK